MRAEAAIQAPKSRVALRQIAAMKWSVSGRTNDSPARSHANDDDDPLDEDDYYDLALEELVTGVYDLRAHWGNWREQ